MVKIKDLIMKKFFSAVANFVKTSDYITILLVLIISAFGVISLMSMRVSGLATERQVLVQILATALGIVGALIMSKIDYNFMAKFWKPICGIAYALVLLTFVIGIRVGDVVDDRAWLQLPFGLTLQPSEILKAAFILTFALHLQRVSAAINRPKTLLVLCAHGAVPIMLVVLQGDDGTALIFTSIFACMLFGAGLSFKYIAAGVGAAAASLPILWYFILSDYQKLRVLTVLNPELDPQGIGWQQLNGLLALGSGQLWGKGLFREDHHPVPMIYNDFIFTFVGEAMGFIGCFALILLIGSLCGRMLYTGFKIKDDMGKFICIGVFAMFASQTILNVGMCLSVLPVIGITLPFVSAGGTSVAVSYIGIGLVLSVYSHNRKALFEVSR